MNSAFIMCKFHFRGVMHMLLEIVLCGVTYLKFSPCRNKSLKFKPYRAKNAIAAKICINWMCHLVSSSEMTWRACIQSVMNLVCTENEILIYNCFPSLKFVD
jgi:hypothetical protein